MSIGVKLCQGLYQTTAALKYDSETKQMKRFINAIDLVPSDKESQLKNHVLALEIFKDDTYKITFDGIEDTERRSLFDDFELSGPKEIIDTEFEQPTEPTPPAGYQELLMSTQNIFQSDIIMGHLQKYANYLNSIIYKKNDNYEPMNHKNILNEKLVKIKGIGLFVSE